MSNEPQRPNIETSASALKSALRENGFFKVMTVGFSGDKLIVYTMSNAKGVRQYIKDKCLGQWQTYPVEVRNIGKVMPATFAGLK